MECGLSIWILCWTENLNIRLISGRSYRLDIGLELFKSTYCIHHMWEREWESEWEREREWEREWENEWERVWCRMRTLKCNRCVYKCRIRTPKPVCGLSIWILCWKENLNIRICGREAGRFCWKKIFWMFNVQSPISGQLPWALVNWHPVFFF